MSPAQTQPQTSLRIRLEKFSDFLENQPRFLLALLAGVYLLAIALPLQRRLWHDELFTYYIAGAPSFDAFIYGVRHIDLNPPMVYVVTRGWQSLFGTNEIVTRIPSAIAFFVASVGFIAFLRRRIGWLWASSGVLLFWASSNFQYATELRPYALLLMFFSITLLCWDSGHTGDKHRPLALAGIVGGGTCLMLCHAFAIFPLGALYLAEIVRTAFRRRIDGMVWICLLLPLGVVLSYFTTSQSQTFEASAFPTRFQGGFLRLIIFWGKGVLGIAIPLGVAAVLAFFATRVKLSNVMAKLRRIAPEDAGLWCGLMMIPFLINLLLSRTHGAFFERYALSSTVAISVTAVVLLAVLTGFNRVASLVVLVAFMVCALQANLFHQPLHQRDRSAFVTDQLHSDLPLVAASGLTFLEMDHYEKPELLSRVYYLTDRPSAIRYANATIFEGMGSLAKYFPIRAHVQPYTDFISEHPRFLVLGTIDYPEDWLLRKLIHEGASVKPLTSLRGLDYKDFIVYEVSGPAH